MADGGAIRLGPGVTLTFDRGFMAPPHQVFSDATEARSRIVFNSTAQSHGHPEWWGARGGDPGVDCAPALAMCVEACAVTRLQACDYWIGSTWKIQLNGRVVEGVNGDADGAEPITRILTNSPSIDMVLVGPDEQPTPGSMRGFVGFIRLKHLTVARATAPDAPPTGVTPGGPCGVRLQWVNISSLEDIWCKESTNGFYIRGTVYCKLCGCHAFRSTASRRAGNDYFAGFLQDNSPKAGLNSGNASLYYDSCGVSGGFQGMSTSYGILTIGGFTDTFIDKMETSGIQQGLVFNGAAQGVEYPSENLMVTNCVIDTPVVGLRVTAPGSQRTAVTVSGCYFGIALPSAQAGILIDHCSGAVTLTGNQLISSQAAPAAVGLAIRDSDGVCAQGNIYTDLANPIVLERANNCRLGDTVNVSRPGLGGSAAVSLASSNRNIVDCVVHGAPPAYGAGASLRASSFNEVRCTGLDPAALRGGAARKLVADGAEIRTAGAFGRGNLATGIMD